jgi:hypothetical protein
MVVCPSNDLTAGQLDFNQRKSKERLPAIPTTGQVSYENLSSIKYIVLLAKDLISSPSPKCGGG